MKCVLQRVTSAHVHIAGDIVGEIGPGLVALVGIEAGDDASTVEWMTSKLVQLRIFSDAEGRFNESLLDVAGSVLSVSQFTLLADVRKGTRPSFTAAAAPELAEPLWELFNTRLRDRGITVATGRFGANMQVSLVNDGPVTIVLERAPTSS